jgi:hypothetical protein
LPSAVGVWVYSDILPKQILTAEQGMLLLQVVALSQADEVPDNLLMQAAADVERFFAQLDG